MPFFEAPYRGCVFGENANKADCILNFGISIKWVASLMFDHSDPCKVAPRTT